MIADVELLESLVRLQTWTAIGVSVLIVLHVLLLFVLTWPTKQERQMNRERRRFKRRVIDGRLPPSAIERVVETARRQGSHD